MATNRLTVLCTNVGNKWDPVWVDRLYAMVEEHCSVPFDFRVITDNPELYPDWGVQLSRPMVWVDGVWQKPDSRLMMNINKPQGCWAKLDCFLPTWGGNPVIHLDLDCVILDDIAPLARTQLHMPWQGDKFNGSVYSFTPNALTEYVYPQVIPYNIYPRGEQEYVQDTFGNVGILHDCYSYKIHIASRYGKNPPEGTRIIYFHGYPTPASDEVQSLPWVKRSWRGLTRVERI